MDRNQENLDRRTQKQLDQVALDQRNPKVSDSEELPSECMINPPCQVFSDPKEKEPERSKMSHYQSMEEKTGMADN